MTTVISWLTVMLPHNQTAIVEPLMQAFTFQWDVDLTKKERDLHNAAQSTVIYGIYKLRNRQGSSYIRMSLA